MQTDRKVNMTSDVLKDNVTFHVRTHNLTTDRQSQGGDLI
jgi:hypothetical protein